MHRRQVHCEGVGAGLGRCRYTAFVIEVRTASGQVWTVEHRYRQFLSLNKVRGVVGVTVPVGTVRAVLPDACMRGGR